MKFKFYLSDCSWYSERRKRNNIGGITFDTPGKDYNRPHEIEVIIDINKPKLIKHINELPIKMINGCGVECDKYMTPETIDIIHKHRFEEFDNDKLTSFYIDKIEKIDNIKESKMKNTDKVTLTVKQLKKLMDESYEDKWTAFTDEGNAIINALDKIFNQLEKVRNSAKYGSKNFENYVETALDSITRAKRSYMV